MTTSNERVIIFQIGSLGDAVISMPCYREIARRHPGAQRFLLTNFATGSKMVQAEAMLKPCGLIDEVVEYPMPLRGAAATVTLLRQMRSLKADVLYYLMPEKRLSRLVRHVAFFRLCGIRRMYGVPWTRDARLPREVVPGEMWESEASRLLRTIGAQSVAQAPAPEDRRLDLTEAEHAAAERLLAERPEVRRFVAISVGGKMPLKDWGDVRWGETLAALSAELPGMGAVFVGSADEHARNDGLAARWNGPTLNACGRLTPRESAALLARAECFMGHDTGTLHLAAAVETRVIGVYSARNEPGKWYSDRPGDVFFYNKPPCFGCELQQVEECPNGIVCMTTHSVPAVVRAGVEVLGHA